MMLKLAVAVLRWSVRCTWVQLLGVVRRGGAGRV